MVKARQQQGFTYLWVLVVIAVLGVGLVAASEVWQTAARRQRLAQLNWAGSQYAQAVGSYYESTPGFAKTYPQRLEELLEDRRFATVRRHLRDTYPNPVASDGKWDLVIGPDLRIHGVRAQLPGATESAPQEWVYVRSATP